MIWYAVRLFRQPIGTFQAMMKRLGGERLPQGLRPRAFPTYLRAHAVLVGLLGALVLVVGVGSLLSAFLW